MFKIMRALIVGLILFGSIAIAENQFVDALIFLRDKKYTESEKTLTSIIETSQSLNKSGRPLVINGHKINLPFVYSTRADCWSGLGEYGKALNDYQEAYRLNKDRKVLYNIARSMYEEGLYDEAVSTFDEYLATANPNRNEKYLALYFKAFSVFKNGDPALAIRDLHELKIKFPELKDATQSTIDQCVSEKERIDALYEQNDERVIAPR